MRDHQLSELEASRLEIGLLACGVLVLVAQLAVFIWICTRRHRHQQAAFEALCHESSTGLAWRPDIKDRIPYEPRLIKQTRHHVRTIMSRVRGRSASFSGTPKQEPAGLRRKMTVSGVPLECQALVVVEEKEVTGAEDGFSRSSAEYWTRPAEPSAHQDDSVRQPSRGRTRRRSSRLGQLPPCPAPELAPRDFENQWL